MKISAQVAIWMCAAFALVCMGFALTGFTSLGTLASEAERDASLGYAWFWTFLATVAAAFGILSWLIAKGTFGPVE